MASAIVVQILRHPPPQAMVFLELKVGDYVGYEIAGDKVVLCKAIIEKVAVPKYQRERRNADSLG